MLIRRLHKPETRPVLHVIHMSNVFLPCLPKRSSARNSGLVPWQSCRESQILTNSIPFSFLWRMIFLYITARSLTLPHSAYRTFIPDEAPIAQQLHYQYDLISIYLLCLGREGRTGELDGVWAVEAGRSEAWRKAWWDQFDIKSPQVCPWAQRACESRILFFKPLHHLSRTYTSLF